MRLAVIWVTNRHWLTIPMFQTQLTLFMIQRVVTRLDDRLGGIIQMKVMTVRIKCTRPTFNWNSSVVGQEAMVFGLIDALNNDDIINVFRGRGSCHWVEGSTL